MALATERMNMGWLNWNIFTLLIKFELKNKESSVEREVGSSFKFQYLSCRSPYLILSSL